MGFTVCLHVCVCIANVGHLNFAKTKNGNIKSDENSSSDEQHLQIESNDMIQYNAINQNAYILQFKFSLSIFCTNK